VDCKTILEIYRLYMMDFRLFQYSLTEYLDTLGKSCPSLLPKNDV
jgi:hypothetical protein